MTTVIAVQQSDHVILASDSQATASNGQKIRMEAGKIYENGDYTFSVAGMYSMIAALEFADLPPLDRSVPARRFAATKIAPVIAKIEKQMLEDLEVPEEVRPMLKSVVVIVVNGEVFVIRSGVVEPKTATGVYVVGSGTPYALGVLSSVPSIDERVVHRALNAAEVNDSGTSGPFSVRKVY